MTDFTGNSSGEDINKNSALAKSRMHIAYTLNNAQPVSCSIIGDQPLFYMDVEDEIYDDEFMDAHEVALLEREISALKQEMKNLDYSPLEATDAEKYAEFQENAISFENQVELEDVSVTELLNTLKVSRLAQAYITCMEEYNVRVMLSAEEETAFYDRKNKVIIISKHLDHATQSLLLARELRRHWQHRQGALIHPLMLNPDSAILINRVRICDLVTSMIRIAWEVQLSGEKSLWNTIEKSSLADLGRAFAREAFLDFRTINNGIASASVFEAWFLSERCLHADKELISQMLADHQGYVFDSTQSLDALNMELICTLGTMPYGKNYLSAHANTIMNDPLFTDVRDRSNANFLWFIKFERSFRETEQELQTPVDQLSGDQSTPLASKYASRGQEHAQQSSAQIIELFSAEQSESNIEQANDKAKKLNGKTNGKISAKKDADRSEKSADIVYLKRWSAE